MAPREHRDFDNIGRYISQHQKWHDSYKKWFLLIDVWGPDIFIAIQEHHNFDILSKNVVSGTMILTILVNVLLGTKNDMIL